MLCQPPRAVACAPRLHHPSAALAPAAVACEPARPRPTPTSYSSFMFPAAACPLTAPVLISLHMHPTVLDFTAARPLQPPRKPLTPTRGRIVHPSMPPAPLSQRSRAHYCYDCLVALTPGVPHVALPFRVSIVTHHEERASKNTGVQVAILAAGQVDLHRCAKGLRAPHTSGATGPQRPVGEVVIAVAVGSHCNACRVGAANTAPQPQFFRAR